MRCAGSRGRGRGRARPRGPPRSARCTGTGRSGRRCVYARERLDAQVVDDGLDAAVEDVEVVEDREHGETVGGGVRVHAAAEGEREWVSNFAVLAEDLEHGAGGGMLLEEAANDVRPGLVHGLEAVEEAQVLGGEEARLHAGENVLDEVGVETLHVCRGVVCACAGSVILYFERT